MSNTLQAVLENDLPEVRQMYHLAFADLYQRAGFRQTGQKVELQPGMTITYFEKNRSDVE